MVGEIVLWSMKMKVGDFYTDEQQAQMMLSWPRGASSK